MGAIKIPSADLLKKIYGAVRVLQAWQRTLRKSIIMTMQNSSLHQDVRRSSETMLTITADRSLLQVSTLILLVLHALTEPM